MSEKDRNTTPNTAFASGKRAKAAILFSSHYERNDVSLMFLAQIIKTLRDFGNGRALRPAIAS
jgi:hypothetical protein